MAAPVEQVKLGYAALFTGFFQAGILGFGGVLPFARRMMVEQRRWLTPEAFADLFSLCQFMPGANIVNIAFAFGARHRGIGGAAAAVSGLLAAPIGIVLALGAVYSRYGDLPLARHGLTGLAAAAAGLVVATALRIAAPTFRKRANLPVAALAFGLVIVAHVSLPITMLILLPVSLGLALWRR